MVESLSLTGGWGAPSILQLSGSAPVPDFKGLENFDLVLAFIVPGLVVVYIRSRFISGRTPSHADNILGYLVISLIHYTFTLPFIEIALSVKEPWTARAAIWISLTLVGPALFGLLLGAWAQKEWGAWIIFRLGLSTIHVIPAAWDWRFSKNSTWGHVCDGDSYERRKRRRVLGPKTCMSQDMYIEEEYAVDEVGAWAARPSKVGILIPVKEIRHIEFWEPS